MGFKKVYKALQEIFPEVDSRALRAVAIEHSKDADTAVEVVLTEVIPFLTEKSTTPSSSSGERSMVKPPSVADDASGKAQMDNAVLMDLTGSDDEQDHSSNFDANAGHHQSALHSDTEHHELQTKANSDHLEVSGECASGETVLSDESQETNSVVVSNQTSNLQTVLSDESREPNTAGAPAQTSDLTNSTLKDSDEGCNDALNCIHATLGYVEEVHRDSDEEKSNTSVGQVASSSSTLEHPDEGASDIISAISSTGYVNEAHRDSDEEKSNISVGQVASSSIPDVLFNPEGSGELVVVPDMLNFDSQFSVVAASKKDALGEMVDIADDFTLNTMVTRSGQICSIDLLEGIIEDARSNKKTLFSAMESVISLMGEVELQEQAAVHAEDATTKGGLDILSRVEDLKKMLQHAKEANDMHAGEVYGERAILATEVRELQSRLLSLSEERDKSLAVLDEMHQVLQSRFEAAEKATKLAEKEKLDKEESARKLLVEQKLVMEKVVAEANMLKQEAEENAKLQEFLVDRGRVVDMLQGEISVICQDVKLLKEKFDERIPFNRSLFSSQTSCILASSSSSSKSTTPDQVDQVNDHQSDSSDNLKKPMDDSIPSTNEQQLCVGPTTGNDRKALVNEQQLCVGPTAGDDRKALADEGWEIFETADYM